MQHFFQIILDYLLNVAVVTLSQLFILFGPLIILAFIMNYVASLVEGYSYNVFGRNGYLYLFGWLGTPVHEAGHALFAIIFGHKINEIRFFTPNSSQFLGYVQHSQNPKSFYQTFGNFFIGIGPILLGSTILFIITYFLFGISLTDFSNVNITSSSFTSWSSFQHLAVNLWESFLSFANFILANSTSHWWKLFLFLYLLFSIGSSITLSPPDIEGALKGFVTFVGFLILFNLLTLWMGNLMTNIFGYISSLFTGFYFLLTISIIVNMLFFVLLFIFDLLRN